MHYHGHRERLKERFKKVGADGLADYELLEMFLFLIIPRGDVKPIAKGLLKRFGSFEHIMQADSQLLCTVPGVGPAIVHGLKVHQALLQRQLQRKVIKKPFLTCFDDIITYMHSHLSFAIREEIWLIYLNGRNQVLGDECHQIGTVNESPLFPREVVKRALDMGALGIIMVHNHPSGDATPSVQDIHLSLHIMEACAPMGLAFMDHIILSKEGYVSCRQKGLLDKD
jgi:DNA repair protein RadC